MSEPAHTVPAGDESGGRGGKGRKGEEEATLGVFSPVYARVFLLAVLFYGANEVSEGPRLYPNRYAPRYLLYLF